MQAKTANARGIMMSDRGFREWQIALADCGIGTDKQLLDELLGKTEISKPTASKAFDGGKNLDLETWIDIFAALELRRETFFTDAEWLRWDRDTLWKNLCGLAADGEDRFGMVLRNQCQTAGAGEIFKTSGYQKRLTTGTEVLMEIPEGSIGYLILIEADPVGHIDLISPSCLSEDPKLTGDIRRLPQHLDPKYQFFKPTILGNNLLWAGIFAQLPNWAWLQNLPSNGLLDLQSEHLMDLWNYASNPPPGSQIWRSSYVVVN